LQAYSSGEMLTGELKKHLIDVLVPIVEAVQRKRATITNDDVQAFMRKRPLKICSMKSNEPILNEDQLSALNRYLEQRSYVCDFSLTASDSALAARVRQDTSPWPHLSRWLNHVRERVDRGEVLPSAKDSQDFQAFKQSIGY